MTINELLDRLASYHSQMTRFTADASHELRSPLAAMRAAVEVALQKPRTAEEYRDVLGSLGEQSDRLTLLVNGLLTLARADVGEIELRLEIVDLSQLAAEIAEMYQPLAEERGVSLAWSGTSPVPVRGDPSRLRQLLTNLVDNAIKFNEPGGTVTIRADRDEHHARLAVTDTGIGIPADRLSHVFERFYQADLARSSGGAGLGLSICRWIVEAHGGTIRASSKPGNGSGFHGRAAPGTTGRRCDDRRPSPEPLNVTSSRSSSNSATVGRVPPILGVHRRGHRRQPAHANYGPDVPPRLLGV